MTGLSLFYLLFILFFMMCRFIEAFRVAPLPFCAIASSILLPPTPSFTLALPLRLCLHAFFCCSPGLFPLITFFCNGYVYYTVKLSLIFPTSLWFLLPLH